jgi:UDP-N-acetylmuramoyl-tripeptide--D-alanyl-D-alanine ligase
VNSNEAVEEFLKLTENRKISVDSREIKEGDVFLALKGEKIDGNDFVLDALNRGAASAFTSRKFNDKRAIYCQDIKDLLMRASRLLLAGAHFEKLISITGSNGKTTTKEIVAFLLSKIGRTFKTEGNLNTEIGLPLSLINGRREFLFARFGVFELGTNNKGDLEKLVSLLEPQVCVLLNVGSAHLGNFGSPEDLLKEKLSIFNSRRMTTAITNGDDTRIREFVRNLKCEKYFFGTGRYDFTLVDFSYDDRSTKVHFVSDGDKFVRLNGLWSAGQIMDFGAAYLVAKGCGLEEPAIDIAGLSLSFNDRFKVEKIHGMTLISDFYNSSLESWRSAVDSIKKIESKRKIAVVGSILEQGTHSGDTHMELGKILGAFDEVLFFNTDRDIEMACGTVKPVLISDDVRELAWWLKENAKKGDLIFFKASRSVFLERVFGKFMELIKDG